MNIKRFLSFFYLVVIPHLRLFTSWEIVAQTFSFSSHLSWKCSELLQRVIFFSTFVKCALRFTKSKCHDNPHIIRNEQNNALWKRVWELLSKKEEDFLKLACFFFFLRTKRKIEKDFDFSFSLKSFPPFHLSQHPLSPTFLPLSFVHL